MFRLILISALFITNICNSLAQFQTVPTEHYLLGVDVEGYEIDLPFSKEKTEESWKKYSSGFGKSEETQSHKTYQAIFGKEIYANEILIFSQIKGNNEQSTIWVGIDPQGIPKDIYPELQEKMEQYVYDFNIKMRKTEAQKKIDESEQAATYMSKEYESLKKDQRKYQQNFEKTSERITSYEEKLIELRADSTQYANKLEALSQAVDSLYIELEKVKSVVEKYRNNIEEIK
jgi:DNA repair exonuclease SbcCD ATPase subunit